MRSATFAIFLCILGWKLAVMTYYKRFDSSNLISDLSYNKKENKISPIIVRITGIGVLIFFVIDFYFFWNLPQFLIGISLAMISLFHYNKGNQTQSLLHGIGLVNSLYWFLFVVIQFRMNVLSICCVVLTMLYSLVIISNRIKKKDSKKCRKVEAPLQKLIYLAFSLISIVIFEMTPLYF